MSMTSMVCMVVIARVVMDMQTRGERDQIRLYLLDPLGRSCGFRKPGLPVTHIDNRTQEA